MKKNNDSFAETGHTLVEMLGILTMIGILSVTGMRLYAKAMNTMRANHVMDRVMTRHVELANEGYTDYGDDSTNAGKEVRRRHQNRGRTFDIGATGDALAYGYKFNADTEAKKIIVDGFFSANMCGLLRERLAENEYQGLMDILAGKDKVSLKEAACPDGITQMAFVFGEGVVEVVDSTPTVVMIQTCEEPNTMCGGRCLPPCIVSDGGTQTGERASDCSCKQCDDGKVWRMAQNMCVCSNSCTAIVGERYTGEQNIDCFCETCAKGKVWSGTECVCSSSCTPTVGGHYTGYQKADCSCEECDEGTTWNGKKCASSTPTPTECPAEKPSEYGASCTYIEGNNCCDVEKGLTCSGEGKCTCASGKVVCKGQCYDECESSTRDPDTCECVTNCPPGQVKCNGQCYGPCSREGQTGERDENCVCKCKENASSETCCEEGYVLRDNRCMAIHCMLVGTGYDCFIGETRCGHGCGVEQKGQGPRLFKVTKAQGAESTACKGYCDNFCPDGSTWGQTSIEYSGLGCQKKGGLYCGTGTNPDGKRVWLCKKEDREDSPVCCQASTFGKCSFGTCDSSICKNITNGTTKYVQIAPDLWGCEVVRDGQTAYCTLKNGQWACYRSQLGGGSVKECGFGTLDNLNSKTSTNFAKCFSAEATCSKSSGATGSYVWDPTWSVKDQLCTGTVKDPQGVDRNDYTYGCDTGGRCYIKKGSSWEQCGYMCQRMGPIHPAYCTHGICYSEFCEKVGTLGKVDNQRYGCFSEREDGTYAYAAGDGVCYYKKKGKTDFQICGYNCNSLSYDCANCKSPVLPQCAAAGKCLENGMEVKDCTCDDKNGGVITEGHCCPLGHTYVDGKCVLATVAKGKCLYKGQAISETDAYGTKNGRNATYTASCECRDETQCMDRSGDTPVCGVCPK